MFFFPFLMIYWPLDLVTEQLINLASAKTLCLEKSVDAKCRESASFVT